MTKADKRKFWKHDERNDDDDFEMWICKRKHFSACAVGLL